MIDTHVYIHVTYHHARQYRQHSRALPDKTDAYQIPYFYSCLTRHRICVLPVFTYVLHTPIYRIRCVMIRVLTVTVASVLFMNLKIRHIMPPLPVTSTVSRLMSWFLVPMDLAVMRTAKFRKCKILWGKIIKTNTVLPPHVKLRLQNALLPARVTILFQMKRFTF